MVLDRMEGIDRIVHRIFRTPHDGNIAMNLTEWDWPSGVAMYAVFRAWRHTGREEYGAALFGWLDRHLPESGQSRNVNRIAPYLAVAECLQMGRGDSRFRKACHDAADWLLLEAPRTRNGGYEHTVSEAGVSFREQMWADTLFMACLFLAKMSRLTGHVGYAEEAARQLRLHVQYLQDPDSGLFHHAWSCEGQNWMSGAKWGRANAWMLIAGLEMLELLPDSFGGREEVLAALRKQAQALLPLQREDGLFGTLLDDPGAYGEASASAGIAYGLRRGANAGLLMREVLPAADRAEATVTALINEQGELTKVSHGTDVKKTLQGYKEVPFVPAFWGQGLALLLLCEEDAVSRSQSQSL